MKTVVMIAPYFVPRRRVGSQRPYKFAIHLRSFGWNPVVFTIDTPGEELTEEEHKRLKGVSVENISPPFDRTADNQDAAAVKEQSAGPKWSETLAERIANEIDRHAPMDTWYFLFRSSYAKILDQVKEIDPDLIWSTGDPWSGHWLGHKLSKHLKKPWVADFRDPWTLSGLHLRKRSAFSNWIDQKLEKKFIHSADKIIFTAKSTEVLYRDYYGLDQNRTETIYNSYDVKETESRKPDNWNKEIDDSRVNLIFFGSFRRLSPIQPIAEAVAELEPEVRDKIAIHSFGTLERKDKETLERLGISDLFNVHEKVVPEAAPGIFQKADILLVSTSGDRKAIIPAKLWEYLVSDKPILSITPNPEIGKILKDTGAGFHFINDQKKEIAGLLEDAVKNKEEGKKILNVHRDRDRIKQFSAEKNTEKLAQIMDRLAGDER